MKDDSREQTEVRTTSKVVIVIGTENPNRKVEEAGGYGFEMLLGWDEEDIVRMGCLEKEACEIST